MKRFVLSAAAIVAAVFAQAQYRMPAMPENVVLSMRDTSPRSPEGRSSNFAPSFFIYPDAAVDSLGAVSLVEKLGLDEIIPVFHASVTVINPVSEKYDEVADYESFEALFNMSRVVGNLKVIGIGNGATFVNQVVAPQAAGAIAGILTIDGKPAKMNRMKSDGVPAYAAGKNAKKVAEGYASMNAAGLKSSEGTVSVYENADEPLLKVVADTESKELGEVFADAWETVLKKNFRFNNYQHTYYNGNTLGEYGPSELVTYTIYEDLGFERNVVIQEQRSGKPWLWYEYWPKELMAGAPEKSVPVMVLLHGNTNDPRTQAETSGFLEVAAEDRFFVVEMEWQGSADFGAMGLDGIESTLYSLFRKYPQLDPSRVYCEGLSAGSMTTVQAGLRKSHIFAAVGGHSGGLFPGNTALMDEVAQKAGWVEMPNFFITGSADMVVKFYDEKDYKTNGIFIAWNTYRKLNGLPEVIEVDFEKYPVFGFELADRETIKTNKGAGITVETGVLYKGDVPIMKFGVVMDYGHWNFKPDARMRWDYFKHFSRDPQTKKVIYTK